MKFKLFFVSVFVFFSFSILKGQHHTSSPYSRYGLGDILPKYNGQTQGTGYSGIALRSPTHLNLMNPASYSSIPIQTFIFELGLSGKMTEFRNKQTNATVYDANINYLTFGFPITKWWSSCFGLVPYSTVGYDLTNVESISNPTEMNIRTTMTGEGGINQFVFGNSFKFLKHFSVGFHLTYLFGVIDRNVTTEFIQERTYSELNSTESLNLHGFYFNWGMQYSQKINDKLYGGIGIIVDNEQEINGSNTRNILINPNGEGNIPVKNDTIEEGGVKLPLNTGIGINLATPKFSLTADYKRQNWSEATFFGETDSRLTNKEQISAGLEYIPDLLSTKYWKIIHYRIGASIDNSYINFKLDDNGNSYEQINSYAITLGAEFPLKTSKTSINVNFEYGSRGTTAHNLLQEDYLIFSLNFSLRDTWFIKRKFY